MADRIDDNSTFNDSDINSTVRDDGNSVLADTGHDGGIRDSGRVGENLEVNEVAEAAEELRRAMHRGGNRKKTWQRREELARRVEQEIKDHPEQAEVYAAKIQAEKRRKMITAIVVLAVCGICALLFKAWVDGAFREGATGLVVQILMRAGAVTAVAYALGAGFSDARSLPRRFAAGAGFVLVFAIGVGVLWSPIADLPSLVSPAQVTLTDVELTSTSHNDELSGRDVEGVKRTFSIQGYRWDDLSRRHPETVTISYLPHTHIVMKIAVGESS